MKYFQRFPTISYALDDNNRDFKQVKNIFARVHFVKEALSNSDLYYSYDMKESDNPEVVAHKLYDDPNRYWIIMLGNNITDPYYGTPLKNQSLDNYIIDKYGSISTAQSTLHHYEKQVTVSTNKNGVIDSQTYKTEITEQYYSDANSAIETITTLPTLNNPVVADTQTVSIDDYDNTPVTITTTTEYVFVTQYDYEIDTNEQKRTVNLMKQEYIVNIEDEFSRLMK
jgi:hypothetical protein